MSKKGIVKRFRPDNWEALVKQLIEECIKAGEVEVDDTNRAQVEGFIRYCVSAGADGMLEGIRAYGVEALVRDRKILIILSKVAVPGRPQFRDPGMSYRDKAGYTGPGRIVFVPDDNDIVKIPLPGEKGGKP